MSFKKVSYDYARPVLQMRRDGRGQDVEKEVREEIQIPECISTLASSVRTTDANSIRRMAKKIGAFFSFGWISVK